MAGRVRVYIATSLDGFIAGPADELDWLPGPSPDAVLPPEVLGFDTFMSQVGAMVMGRRTLEVVLGMEGDWFYGSTPILVPTHRPLQTRISTVRPASGSIESILDEALALAGGKDVYVDGGTVIRSALDAGRIDHLVVTMIPVILGRGIPLFAGAEKRHAMEILSLVSYGGGMAQIQFQPKRGA